MMVEETYLRDYKDGTIVVSYEGNTEDINRIRDFVNHMYDAPDTCEDNSQKKEMVRHPSHYNSSSIECINEMILLYGVEETKSFCKLNLHKYRARANNKGGEEDMKKADFYMVEYMWLCSKPEYEIIEEVVEKYKHLVN